MRVVLDTVIFVRALINPGGRWGQLLFDRRDEYEILTSPEITREILGVIKRPKLRKRFTAMAAVPRIDQILELIERSEVVEPVNRIEVCRDPKDDKFLECAVEGRAQYIISEDKDLLDIKMYEAIRIISAAEFLELLAED